MSIRLKVCDFLSGNFAVQLSWSRLIRGITTGIGLRWEGTSRNYGTPMFLRDLLELARAALSARIPTCLIILVQK